MINLPEVPIIDDARNDTHTSTTRVRLFSAIAQKTKGETSDAL